MYQRSDITIPTNGALGQFLRVMINGGIAALAGQNDKEFGVLKTPILSIDTEATVHPANAPGTYTFIANGAITQWAYVYGAASGKVTGTPNGNKIGVAFTSSTNDGDQIEVLRTGTSGSGVLFEMIGASDTVTATTAETEYLQSAATMASNIPGNLLKAGDVIEIEGLVDTTGTNSTDTLNTKLYIGATVIASSGAFDVANNDPIYFYAKLKIDTVGANGTFVASGEITTATAGGSLKSFLLASTTIDTTVSEHVKVTGTWSTNNAGNISKLLEFEVRHRAA